MAEILARIYIFLAASCILRRGLHDWPGRSTKLLSFFLSRFPSVDGPRLLNCVIDCPQDKTPTELLQSLIFSKRIESAPTWNNSIVLRLAAASKLTSQDDETYILVCHQERFPRLRS